MYIVEGDLCELACSDVACLHFCCFRVSGVGYVDVMQNFHLGIYLGNAV